MREHFSPELGRLSKCTTDNCPYGKFDSSKVSQREEVFGEGTLRPLKGGSYFGVPVSRNVLSSVLNQLSSAMSEDLFELVTKNQSERDSGVYHMTIIDPKETRELKKNGNRIADNASFAYKVLGLGTAKNDTGQTWFAVVRSPTAQSFRKELGFSEKDFHITIGFTSKDIHSIPKGENTLY